MNEELLPGAVAPATGRLIGSRLTLDLAWIIVVVGGVVVSSLLPLVERDGAQLSTSDAPLRVYAIGLTLIGCVVGVIARWRRSASLMAASLGLLASSVALVGSVGASLFFDRASAFAGGGAPASFVAGCLGVVALTRWFVYLPEAGLGAPRPSALFGRAVVGVGALATLIIVVTGIVEAGAWSARFLVQLVFALTVPLVILGSGLARSVPAFVLGGSAASGQFVAVLVARAETPSVPLTSDLALWTGVVGLAVFAVAAITVLAGCRLAGVDDPAGPELVDDESWRWNADDA